MITGPRLSYGVFFLAGSLAAFGPARAAETEARRARAIEPDRVLRGLKSPRGLVSVIVKLDAEPLAAYDGGLAGLAPTSPQGTRAPLHRGSASVRAYERFLAARESAFSEAIE